MNVNKVDTDYRVPDVTSFYYALKIRDVFYLSPHIETVDLTISNIGRASERKDIQHALCIRYI